MILVRLCLVALFVFAFSAQAQQPNWTKSQMEVWDIVQKSWVDDAAENGNWPKDYLHDDYVSWGASSGGPSYKDSTIKWSRYSDESSSTLIFENSPASITVAGDTAVVNYYSTTVTTDSEGKRTRSVARISEVLIKGGNKWMFLAGSSFEPKMN
nr:nuclear transport factor 2 family protein [uncultured Glaciecola sp.]